MKKDSVELYSQLEKIYSKNTKSFQSVRFTDEGSNMIKDLFLLSPKS